MGDAVVPFSRRIKNYSIVLIDTPGLQEKDSFSFSSLSKITRFLHLSSVVDIVMFCKRMDIYHDEPNEQEAISILTMYMGKDIWRRTVLALTRAGFVLERRAEFVRFFTSNPSALELENFVLKRIELFQKRVFEESNSLIPLVTFVENCRARMRLDGQMVLPDGTVWVVNFLRAISKFLETDPVPYNWVVVRESLLPLKHKRKWLIPFFVILHLSFKFCLRVITVEDNLSGDSDGPYEQSKIAKNREIAAETCIRDKLRLAQKKTMLTVQNSKL